jgi:hypothetical protein
MEIHRIFVVVSIVVAGTLLSAIEANAHGWYPKECCHRDDCTPVESVERFVPAGGGVPQLLVTTKRGTTLVPQDFPVRQSKDSRMHICVRANEYGHDDVMCLFMPPSM